MPGDDVAWQRLALRESEGYRFWGPIGPYFNCIFCSSRDLQDRDQMVPIFGLWLAGSRRTVSCSARLPGRRQPCIFDSAQGVLPSVLQSDSRTLLPGRAQN